VVSETRNKKMGMQRLVGLLAGFQTGNLGKYALMAWREAVFAAHLGTSHLRKVGPHRYCLPRHMIVLVAPKLTH